MILSFAALKGGVGKSTTAIHVACYLSNSGKVLVIDGDPNHSILHYQQRGDLPVDVISQTDFDSKLPQHPTFPQEYDHIVIDTPANSSQEELATLGVESDLLIVPTFPEIMALETLGQTLKNVQRFKILITRARHNTSEGREAKQFLQVQELPVFRTMIRDYVAYGKAAVAGVPVYRSDDRNASKAWSDYEAVGDEIMEGLK